MQCPPKQSLLQTSTHSAKKTKTRQTNQETNRQIDKQTNKRQQQQKYQKCSMISLSPNQLNIADIMTIPHFTQKWLSVTRSNKSICAPPRFQKFPHGCLWFTISSVRLTDDGPLPSSFHASLLQAIDDMMSLALCLQHFRSSETQAPCNGCFPASLSARSFPLTLVCPGQYIGRSLRR